MEKIDAVIDVFATCFQSVYVENYQSDVVHKYLPFPPSPSFCVRVFMLRWVLSQLTGCRLSTVVCRLRAFNEMCFKMEARFEHLFNEPSKRTSKRFAMPYAKCHIPKQNPSGLSNFQMSQRKIKFSVTGIGILACQLHYSVALTVSRNKNALHWGSQSSSARIEIHVCGTAHTRDFIRRKA